MIKVWRDFRFSKKSKIYSRFSVKIDLKMSDILSRNLRKIIPKNELKTGY